MNERLTRLLAALLVTLIALCATACGDETRQEIDCVLPTAVTPGSAACSVEFANRGGDTCYDAEYKIDCTKASSGYDCTCVRNGATEKTCNSATICDGVSTENTNTVTYVNACCGWSVAR
jgi:hypothetical protein